MYDVDSLFQSLIFSYYQNSFSLPEKIILNVKPKDIPLIKQAATLKFGKKILISTTINSNIRKIAKLAKLNANQAIENRVNQSDKYSFASRDLASYLAISKKYLTIEGIDISHHGGQNAVASVIRFTSQGPDKSNYKLFNIPKELAGNDLGSMKHVLERRIKRANVNPLPDIILVDGGKLQLEVALSTFDTLLNKPPIILSIVKGSKRVRSTETILSKDGIIEISKASAGFILLQQVRDESHRFAITSNRKKKNKSIKKSSLDNIKGVGPKKRKDLINFFKSIQSIKTASVNDLSKVPGISIKLAKEINLFYTS